MMVRSIFVVAAGLLASAGARAQCPVIRHDLAHPQPVANALFGGSIAVLDFDANGILDIAVTAAGEGAVYLFLGSGDPMAPFPQYHRWTVAGALAASFGTDLAAGELDDVTGDELVIGAANAKVGADAAAGALYVFGRSFPGTPWRVVSSDPRTNMRLGTSLVVGDFHGSPGNEIAAGAPNPGGAQFGAVVGGEVELFDRDGVPLLILNNPQNSTNGNFGHDVARTDYDGDGDSDLIVSAVGNSSANHVNGGQVFVYYGPVGSTSEVLDGPGSMTNPSDDIRFGMSVAGGDEFVLVGAPRLDLTAPCPNPPTPCQNHGRGYVFEYSPPSLAEFTSSPSANEGLFGYRALGANLLGDPRPDYVFVALKNLDPASGIWAWDSNDPTTTCHIPQPDATNDHWAQGAAHGYLFSNCYEELVFGAIHWPHPTEGPNVGCVVILEPRTECPPP